VNLIRQQLKKAQSVTPLDGGNFTAEFELAPDFAGFRGHFPEAPVMPGVCIIAAVILAASEAVGSAQKLTRLKSAKFYSPVMPKDRVEIRASIDTAQSPSQVRATLTCGDRKVAKISMFVEPSDQQVQD